MQKTSNKSLDSMSLKSSNTSLFNFEKSQITKSLSNTILAIDYTVSFYKNNLYLRYRSIRPTIDLTLDQDRGQGLRVDLDFVTDNFYDAINIIKNLQAISHDLLNSFNSSKDIRADLSQISLLLDILGNRKIFSIKSINIIKIAINNLSLSISNYYNKQQEDKSDNVQNIKDDNIIYDLSFYEDQGSDIHQRLEEIIKKDTLETNFQKDKTNFKLESYKSKFQNITNKALSKDSYKDKDMEQMVNKFKNLDQRSMINTDIRQQQNILSSNSANIIKDNNIIADRGDMRRQVILKILNVGEYMSIKDISDNVSGCSEKTIQRDLNAMLDMGLIKKIGEKRWSKYSAI